MGSEESIKRQDRERPILRGTKIAVFLLGVMFTTILSSGFLTRPTQAVFFNSPLACWLNIGVCPTPGSEPDTPTNPGEIVNPTDPTENPGPGEDPTEPENPTDPVDPEEPVTDDMIPPEVTLDVDHVIAGGNIQTVTITGAVSDENLTSYVLSLNANVVQQAVDITETSVPISAPWSVSTPNKVPSGEYTIKLEATDKAGNVFSQEKVVVVDNDGPDVSTTGGDVIIKSGSISPKVTATDPRGVASYSWADDKNNPGAIDYDRSVAEPVFTPYFEGTYVFYLTVADELGNLSTVKFSFGYARQLAILPLPIVENLNEKLVTTPSATTPAVTPASSNPAQETATNENVAVLGSTIAPAGPSSLAAAASAIAPTTSGWSILGILWYWWVIAIAIIFAVWMGVKKVILRRITQDS